MISNTLADCIAGDLTIAAHNTLTSNPYVTITYNQKSAAELIKEIIENHKEDFSQLTSKSTKTETNKENNMKNVLFLAPGPQYAKTVIENQGKTLDRKKIPYNASTKFSDMYLRTDKVNMEIVYMDPIKWTAELFKNRDAVFGKKELVDKAMDMLVTIRINRPHMSLSAYFNQAHAQDMVETTKPRETYIPEIKNAYFNDPVTVVIWEDGTKTVVKCQDGDEYSAETGLALCIAKKALGNMPNFNNIFRKWIPNHQPITASEPTLLDIGVKAKSLAAGIMAKYREARDAQNSVEE